VAAAWIGAVAQEAHALADPQRTGQALKARSPRTAGDQQTEGRLSRQTAHRMEQRLQAFEIIIHADEQGHRFPGSNVPAQPALQAAPQAIVLDEPAGVDGTAKDAQLPRTDAVVALEVPTYHLAVHEHKRARPSQILSSLQGRKRP